MACVYEEEADDVCRLVMHIGVDLGRSVQNSAMGMYAWYGIVDIAWRFFVGILAKDLVFWASVVEFYAQANFPMAVLKLCK